MGEWERFLALRLGTRWKGRDSPRDCFLLARTRYLRTGTWRWLRWLLAFEFVDELLDTDLRGFGVGGHP